MSNGSETGKESNFKPGKTKNKKPTTVEEALDQGYEQKGFMMPSDPPVLFLKKMERLFVLDQNQSISQI